MSAKDKVIICWSIILLIAVLKFHPFTIEIPVLKQAVTASQGK